MGKARGAVLGMAALGIAGTQAPSFVLPAVRAPGSSRLAVGTVASEATSSPAGIPTSGVAAAALCASAAASATAARCQGKARKNANPVAMRARGGDDWQPRMEGWTPQELATQRAQIAASPGPDASYSGPRYNDKTSVTPQFLDQLIAMQATGVILPIRDAKLMVLDFIEVLRAEPTMPEVTVAAGKELTVCGDLHGQYWDFMNLLKMAGRPSPETPFLFNGDFVDRGSWSIEVIMVLVAFKLKDPGFVHMNRGNHEMLETNILYGFAGECGGKYDMAIFDLFSEAFRNLPLCHLVNKKVLVLHAGLPGPDPRIWMPGQTHDPTDSIPMTTLPSLAQINAVDRYTEITPECYAESIGPTTSDKTANDQRIIIDMLWGDPRGGIGYGPSYRKTKGVYMFGPDVTERFCQENGLQCIIRSHEVKADGFRWDHPKLLSVFSAPNYLDTGNNKASYVKLGSAGPGANLTITTTDFTHVPHPDIAPMHWQDHLANNYPFLLRKMKKREAQVFDEFGDSDFEGMGLMNFDEWEPDEAESFQEAFKYDSYGRPLEAKE
mmetsp:Transcript_32861/g.71657  ORF Transcript_32861/g.71657 Transcript_32861/m.71657 type:complete len:551 (+) Transcript_32861:71-1723(+)